MLSWPSFAVLPCASVRLALPFLLSIRYPDVLDLSRLSQEFPPFALHVVMPVPRVPLDPRPLHVSRGRPLDLGAGRLTAEIPHRIHIVVLREHLRERVFGPSDDVDHTGRHVGGVEP